MRKVVVIGGSAGGIDAVCSIVRHLPTDFSAPILIVIHIGETENMLPAVLQRCTKVEVVSPAEPEPIVASRIYVAPPNRHLVVRADCVMAIQGPRENRHRPAIDTLFRSVARAYRSNVVAVIVSGALDDGVTGCLAVQARGGTVIVQDPTEAQIDAMPANVLRQIKTAHCLRLEKIATSLLELASNGKPIRQNNGRPIHCPDEAESFPMTEPLAYTCPECHGTLLKISDGKSEQFRCNVGHIYSLDSFSVAHSNAVERALWMALERLNEKRSVQGHLAKRAKDAIMKRRYHENAAAAAEDMRLLKEILGRLLA
jgi:two-component system chemotaxis response regulator CheB